MLLIVPLPILFAVSSLLMSGGLGDWNALAGAQLETQDGFR